MPYNKLKLHPTQMADTGKGHVHSRVFLGCKYFFKGGNRPYREDWSHIDNVSIEVMNHMQQKIHRQALPALIFLAAIKFCLQTILQYQKLGSAKNQAPIFNAKG